MIKAHGTRTVYMRLGPEGPIVGAELRVTDPQHGEVGRTRTHWVQNVHRASQRDVGCRKEFSLG